MVRCEAWQRLKGENKCLPPSGPYSSAGRCSAARAQGWRSSSRRAAAAGKMDQNEGAVSGAWAEQKGSGPPPPGCTCDTLPIIMTLPSGYSGSSGTLIVGHARVSDAARKVAVAQRPTRARPTSRQSQSPCRRPTPSFRRCPRRLPCGAGGGGGGGRRGVRRGVARERKRARERRGAPIQARFSLLPPSSSTARNSDSCPERTLRGVG